MQAPLKVESPVAALKGAGALALLDLALRAEQAL